MTKEEILDTKDKWSTEGIPFAISFTDALEAMDIHSKQTAIGFQSWVRKNYSISKGKYRHRGDFYKNDKLINEAELFTRYEQHLQSL